MGHAFDTFHNESCSGRRAELLFHAVIDPISTGMSFNFQASAIRICGASRTAILWASTPASSAHKQGKPGHQGHEHWRDYVKFPEIPKDLDWSYARPSAKPPMSAASIMVPTFRGLFERFHFCAFGCVGGLYPVPG